MSLSQNIEQIEVKVLMQLYQESEILYNTGMIEEGALIRSISNDCFERDNYSDLLKVSLEVYRRLAICAVNHGLPE
jgi:phage tail tube protein FII